MTPGHSKQNVVCPLVLELWILPTLCIEWDYNIKIDFDGRGWDGIDSVAWQEVVVSRLVIDIWGSGRLGYDV
jgi:hypothetical protein